MMKTILFDLTCSQPLSSHYHGAGNYTQAIFIALCNNLDLVNIKALYNGNVILNDLLIKKCNDNHIELIDIGNKSHSEVVEEIMPNIYFTALPSKNRIVHVSGVSFVTVCHDIRTLDCYFDPMYYQFCQNWRDLIFLADNVLLNGYLARKNTLSNLNMFVGKSNTNIIAVSRHTKYHLLSTFPNISPNSIPVFYSPNLEILTNNNFTEKLPDELVKKKYFLMDSGWRWMKNNLRAALAFDQVFTENESLDFKVVITGVKSAKPYLSKLINKEKFIFLDYVNNSLLDTLHKDAYCFVYPSLAEGFGYSPLKSMKYEVPVIASSVSSIPEVCGDAVLYTNPKSITEIKNRILQILDNEIYDQFKNKSLKHYKKIAKKQNEDLDAFVEYMLSI